MDVARLDEGLWRWSTRYGEWGEEVGCLYVEAEDAVVLVDPLVPEEPGEEGRFWRALDRDVSRCGTPVHVLVTVFWHTRSSARMVERYGARVHAVSGARRSEVVFWLPAHRALATGDVILGADGGGLRLCPVTWLPSGIDHARLRDSLQPLLELPVERVLVSHGAPVLRAGHAALAAALGTDGV
jgi:glyoxylase-like metal-dependent hydrolase (beta-lactamase superfamily II)